MRLASIIGIFVVILLAGVGTGYGLSMITGNQTVTNGPVAGAPGTVNADEIAVGKVYGADSDKKFPDSSEGVIERGGMDGEGTHHLVRPGGKTQTVYLTSSVIDLDLFVGHKVEVKGETFSAQKAAWFMDVGSVKVIALNASAPQEATEATPQE